MNKLSLTLLILFASTALHGECVPGGLAVVVPKTNATDGISMAQLRKLVMGDAHTWPDKSKVLLVTTDTDGTTFKCLLTEAVRMTTPEYHKYLLNAEFRGDEPLQIRTVDSPAGAVRTVSSSAGSFSVVGAASLSALGGSVKVLSINGKQPGEPGYPL
jgi:hypothetical protein